MANAEHVKILRSGGSKWNEWRALSNVARPDLKGLDFKTLDPNGVELIDVNLAGADLSGVVINEPVSWCIGGFFGGVVLWDADLRGANLSNADLRHAELDGADLSGAIMDRTNLAHARLGQTILARVDLSTVIGLAEVDHTKPSSIGLDTVLLSRGTIPSEFLRGCGYDPIVQPLLLGDRRVLTEQAYAAAEGTAIRLQSCFISYSDNDKAIADRLQEALNARGVDYWYAPMHGVWGRELASQIDAEISARDRVVLLCSASSLESRWVRWEIDRSIQAEVQRGRCVLFPLMLDDSLLNWNDPRGSRLLEVLAGDFRGQVSDSAFASAIERLCIGLRTSK
jgi:hypothetical protein